MPEFYDTATIHQINFTSETSECKTLNEQCIPMRLPEFPPNHHQPYQWRMEHSVGWAMANDIIYFSVGSLASCLHSFLFISIEMGLLLKWKNNTFRFGGWGIGGCDNMVANRMFFIQIQITMWKQFRSNPFLIVIQTTNQQTSVNTPNSGKMLSNIKHSMALCFENIKNGSFWHW